MKENKQQQGTPNPINPNITEWFSPDGKRVMQYINIFDHYRFGTVLDSGCIVFYSTAKYAASKYTIGQLLEKLNA